MNTLLITKGGTSLAPILAIVFTVLKLTDVIGWSWWWVLSPLWLPLAFAGILSIIGIFLAHKIMSK